MEAATQFSRDLAAVVAADLARRGVPVRAVAVTGGPVGEEVAVVSNPRLW